MTCSLEDLKHNMCKWPSGDPKHDDFHFCGNKTAAPESPYCDFHVRMAYRDGSKSSSAAGQKKAA